MSYWRNRPRDPNKPKRVKRPPKWNGDINAKNFYSTMEWKEARERTFERFGKKCIKCNSTEKLFITPTLRIKDFPHLAFNSDYLRPFCHVCRKEVMNHRHQKLLTHRAP